MKKQQSGFTLIELVIVIVILGLLAATALPRFADLTGQAEQASAEGALGAVKSASGISHAMWLATNQGATVDLEGILIAMQFGYPSAQVADLGIEEAAGLAPADFTVATTTARAAGVGAVATITVTGGTCNFTYTEPAAANTSPQYSAVVCP